MNHEGLRKGLSRPIEARSDVGEYLGSSEALSMPLIWPFPTFKGKPYKQPRDYKKRLQDKMLSKAEPALL